MADTYYDRERDDCPYSWLNEWLCEYVDGTMDPSVRAVFDEYLEANPKLAEHVEQLCRTRSLLCQCEEGRSAPEELRARLCEQTEREMMQAPLPFFSSGELNMTVAAGSAMLVVLTVGIAIGATFFAEGPLPARQGADRVSVRAEAPPRPPARPAVPIGPLFTTQNVSSSPLAGGTVWQALMSPRPTQAPAMQGHRRLSLRDTSGGGWILAVDP